MPSAPLAVVSSNPRLDVALFMPVGTTPRHSFCGPTTIWPKFLARLVYCPAGLRGIRFDCAFILCILSILLIRVLCRLSFPLIAAILNQNNSFKGAVA